MSSSKTQDPAVSPLRTLDVLVQEHSRLRALLDNIPDIVFFKDNAGRYLDCNAAFTDLLGLSRYEVIGQTDQDIAATNAEETQQRDEQVQATEMPVRFRSASLNRHGETLQLEVIKAPVFDNLGQMLGIVGIGRDITRQQDMEDSLQMAASVFANAHDGIMITDRNQIIVEVNAAFESLTGYSREEIIGQSPRVLKSLRHDSTFYQSMWASIHAHGFWKGEIWNRRKSGEIYLEKATIIAVHNAEGEVTHYLAMFSDITELKATEERLRYMAHHDALTHLPNRTLLADRIDMALAQAYRRDTQLAVCYIDLDGFKPVNDSYGHAAGDRLLVDIARRLTDCLRAGDTVARLGGDEFALLLTDLDSADQARGLLNRVLTVVAAPFAVSPDTAVNVSASIGFTLFPTDHSDADTLLRHADLAMYQAKVSGRNRIHQFDFVQDKLERSHLETRARIADGLENEEFELYFQPLVDMRAGKVIGAEALIRWQHPERGLVYPGEFLHFVENTDTIVDIGKWVLTRVLQYLDEWNTRGLDLQVSVNIAPRHIMEPGFVDELKTLLAGYPDIRPEQLELEILETAALEDISHVSVLIDECRKLGVKFALDDFGTGYSSLTYFKRLNANTLKIDQSFVRDILDDPEDLAIVEGILGLTNAFKRHAIAEGVETIEHGILLLRLGCNFAQGYGIARPMRASLLPGWVESFVPDPSWISSTTLHWERRNFPLVAVEVEHRRWVDEMTRAVENGTPEQLPPHATDPRACRFGNWYHGHGELEYGYIPEFADIGPLYAELYRIGGHIAELLENGCQEEARSALPELYAASEQLVDALRILQVVVAMGSS